MADGVQEPQREQRVAPAVAAIAGDRQALQHDVDCGGRGGPAPGGGAGRRPAGLAGDRRARRHRLAEREHRLGEALLAAERAPGDDEHRQAVRPAHPDLVRGDAQAGVAQLVAGGGEHVVGREPRGRGGLGEQLGRVEVEAAAPGESRGGDRKGPPAPRSAASAAQRSAASPPRGASAGHASGTRSARARASTARRAATWAPAERHSAEPWNASPDTGVQAASGKRLSTRSTARYAHGSARSKANSGRRCGPSRAAQPRVSDAPPVAYSRPPCPAPARPRARAPGGARDR